MTEPTLTAVLAVIPAAEAVVGEHRRSLDQAASWGVPAHVTVLFPFVPPGDLDDDVVRRLAAAVASRPAFDCGFERCGWFGEDVLWLAPSCDQEFRDLTHAVVTEFPDHQPYGGAFDDVVPHLTVGHSFGEVTPEDLRAVEADVTRQLPVHARIDHVELVAGAEQPDSWRTVATLPLAPRAS